MIVGIDLGTTNSLVAYFTEDGPKIIPNRLGKNLTPSVVSVDENGTVYVGETAKERMSLYPDSVAETFKRSMGTERTYNLSGHQFKPEELSSFVLRALKEDAEVFLGEEVTEAVISVPAYFDDKRRKATKRAGELAGLKVERMISEPTAAAVAYGLYDKTQDTRFLVFDLGGGTFDVSILELYHNILEVRAVAGDNYLGGEDFTQEMARLFLKKADMQLADLNEKEQVRLDNAAEKAKRELNDQSTVTMSFLYQEEKKEVQITAKEYEEACEELLGKIREPVKKSLADAKLKLSDIDEILLIGGATRLSIVRDFLIRLFRKFPDTKLNPDETVALGAAVQAAMKERREEVKEVILTDVCSFTLGTEVVVEYDEGKFEDGRFCPIIERNTVIPASRTERLYTVRDNQTSVRVRVLQGESRFARNNLYLGELEIEVPKGPKGQESVDVTYTYDINSLLEVEVKVVSTGISKKMIIKGDANQMTEEEIQKRMEELAYLKIQPRDYEENRLVLLRAERMYEESLGERRQKLDHYITRFEAALKKGDHEEIQERAEKWSFPIGAVCRVGNPVVWKWRKCIMSIELKCGSCGKKLLSYEARERKYGPLIKTCKKCGAKYLDPRYHELAVDGIPEDVFGIPQYLVMVVIGILISWRGTYLFSVHQLGTPDEVQWLLPTLFLVFGIVLIIGGIVEIIRVKTGMMRKKYEKLYEESNQRMRYDREYVMELRRLGYPVPEQFQ